MIPALATFGFSTHLVSLELMVRRLTGLSIYHLAVSSGGGGSVVPVPIVMGSYFLIPRTLICGLYAHKPQLGRVNLLSIPSLASSTAQHSLQPSAQQAHLSI
jgi:hypothetical protein